MPPVVLTAVHNTFVSSAQPNNIFSFYPLLYTGKDEIFGTCTSLLKFDFTTVATRSVDSAFLQLSVIVKTEESKSPIVVNRLTGSFDANYVTYDRIPGKVETPSEFKITSEDLNKTVQIDVTQLVNDWLGGVYENHGIALTNRDGVSLVQFGSGRIGWEPYFPKLILKYASDGPETDNLYGSNTSVVPQAEIPYNDKGFMQGVSYIDGSNSVTIEEDGAYAVWFTVSNQSQNQYALFQNDILLSGSIYGMDLQSDLTNIGMSVINAQAGDQLTVRNRSSAEPVPLSNKSDESVNDITALIFVWKFNPSDISSNISQGKSSAKTPGKASGKISEKSADKSLPPLDTAVNVPTENYVAADPKNIYVEAGATNGAGNRSRPFGTIEQALSVVEAGGTVHLTGTFETVGTINITKVGVTLLGEGDSQIIAASDSIPVIITVPVVTLNGITISSPHNYPTELIRIMASEARIINCNLTGPGKTETAKLLAGISTVEERANNYIIKNNRISSLDTGIQLLESSQGEVVANNISDTRYGITIDGGNAKIEGNTWLGLPNGADIVITAQTPSGPPHYNEVELSAANNNAAITDKRTQ